MTDESLIIQTKNYVKQERVLLKQILFNLKEIESRKLYLKRGYSSIFTFCTRVLGYSESAAQRRIDAMRAYKEIPEIADKIAEGKLSLSCVAMVQKTLRRENKRENKDKTENINKSISISSKRKLFKSIESKSQREVEQVLVQQFPQSHLLDKPDMTRTLTSEKSEVKFIADEGLIKKLQKIKALYSHKNINPSYNELLHLMADQILKKQVAKTNGIKNTGGQIDRPTNSNVNLKNCSTEKEDYLHQLKTASSQGRLLEGKYKKSLITSPEGTTKKDCSSVQLGNAPSQSKLFSRSRYIKKNVRQELFIRDQGKCQYVDPFTLKKCNSEHLVQVDHIKAYSKGGGAELNNLQLLCAGHNQLKSNK